MTRITQKLDIRHGQQLVMTPQLQQAIKLLQLNNMELAEFIEEELAQNPLLEKEDPQPEDAPAEETAKEETDNIQQDFDEALPDFDPGSDMAAMGAGGNTRFEGMDEGLENRVQTEKTLREHLTEQMFIAFDDNRDRVIGALLIDQLDESGYLRGDMTVLAEQLGASRERIERLLHTMKSFDPAGIFARDLSECLSLQLREKGTLDAPMEKLLANLECLAAHEYKKLAGLCGVNETYLRDMIEEIRALNPRPAAEFEHVQVQTAIPDVLMKRLPKNLGGGWRVELNAETLPKVLINQTYYTEVSKSTANPKDREYLSRQINSANWLVRALDQRAQTIVKVAGEIVEQQDAFFNYGIEFLRPLTLKDIAEIIGMHESTVSRVTTNKFIGTPRGIFELKFFFSTALESEDGTSHSAEAVKARIKSLIEAENPDKVLSDDAIVDTLKAEGIDLARRTVAKYREGMNIPSSILRRRQKKNA